jgi:hypothetical protein
MGRNQKLLVVHYEDGLAELSKGKTGFSSMRIKIQLETILCW